MFGIQRVQPYRLGDGFLARRGPEQSVSALSIKSGTRWSIPFLGTIWFRDRHPAAALGACELESRAEREQCLVGYPQPNHGARPAPKVPAGGTAMERESDRSRRRIPRFGSCRALCCGIG